jgi:hypothetical protein
VLREYVFSVSVAFGFVYYFIGFGVSLGVGVAGIILILQFLYSLGVVDLYILLFFFSENDILKIASA